MEDQFEAGGGMKTHEIRWNHPRVSSSSTSLPSCFLGSGPKGPMSCRTQGGISSRPSFCPSPPPLNTKALPALNFALQASNWPSRLQISPPSGSNLTFRPHFCPPDVQIALQASNQPSKHQICPPRLKFALQTSNPLSKPQFCPPAFKYAFFGLNQSSIARNVPPQDVWKFPPVFYRTSALWGRCPKSRLTE